MTRARLRQATPVGRSGSSVNGYTQALACILVTFQVDRGPTKKDVGSFECSACPQHYLLPRLLPGRNRKFGISVFKRQLARKIHRSSWRRKKKILGIALQAAGPRRAGRLNSFGGQHPHPGPQGGGSRVCFGANRRAYRCARGITRPE